LDGLQLLVEVVAVTVASRVALAGVWQVIEAPDDPFEMRALIVGSVGHATALGLGQYLGNQVVAGIVAIGLVQQRQHFNRGVAVMDGLAGQATAVVVVRARDQLALSAQDFVMHRIALEITDDPAVEVDLVQVPAAVVQVVEFALVGQDQRLQVAQLVIAVLQQASAVGFAEQLPVGVVGVVELLLFSFVVRKGDGQQIVGGVVAVVGGAIFGALAEKTADCVALEVMADGDRAFGAFYTCPETGWRVVVPYDFYAG